MRYRYEVMGNHSGSVRADGWSYGIAEHFTKHGVLFCVDAHRDGKRFIVKADDLLTAFLSLERDAIAPKEANTVQLPHVDLLRRRSTTRFRTLGPFLQKTEKVFARS